MCSCTHKSLEQFSSGGIYRHKKINSLSRSSSVLAETRLDESERVLTLGTFSAWACIHFNGQNKFLFWPVNWINAQMLGKHQVFFFLPGGKASRRGGESAPSAWGLKTFERLTDRAGWCATQYGPSMQMPWMQRACASDVHPWAHTAHNVGAPFSRNSRQPLLKFYRLPAGPDGVPVPSTHT